MPPPPITTTSSSSSNVIPASSSSSSSPSQLSSWFRILIIGIGFLIDSYDIFIINLSKNILQNLYPATIQEISLISSASFIGAIIGQLFFGSIADQIGRRIIFICTLSLVIIGSIGSATATAYYSSSASSYTLGNIYIQLAFWRFLLGLGVGGEYPLSATVSAESSESNTNTSLTSSSEHGSPAPSNESISTIVNLVTTPPSLDDSNDDDNEVSHTFQTRPLSIRQRLLTWSRSQQIATVFSFQGLGSICGSIIFSILLSIPSLSLDNIWRIAVSIGAIPSILMIYWRLQLEESKDYLQSKLKTEQYIVQQQQQQQQNNIDTKNTSNTNSTEEQKDNIGNNINHPSIPNNIRNVNEDDVIIENDDNSINDDEEMSLLDDITDTTKFSNSAKQSTKKKLHTSTHISQPSHKKTLSTSTIDSISLSSTSNFGITYIFYRLFCCSPRRILNTQYIFSILYNYRYILYGTCGNWLLLDIIFYGNNLFSGTILDMMGISFNSTVIKIPNNITTTTTDFDEINFRHRILNETYGNLFLTIMGYLGMIISIFFIDYIGKKILQFTGFLFLAIIYLLLGILIPILLIDHRYKLDQYPNMGITIIIIMYSLTFLCCNLPNTTTFIIPAEIFPTEVKATCHGISAASGKFGAIIGAIIMGPLLSSTFISSSTMDSENNTSTNTTSSNNHHYMVPLEITNNNKYRALQYVMYLSSAIAFIGAVWTFKFTR